MPELPKRSAPYYQVDASGCLDDPVNRLRRPDRSAALKRAREDAAYTEHMRQGIQEARADPRPALPKEEAERHMDKVRAGLQVHLDAALAGKKDVTE